MVRVNDTPMLQWQVPNVCDSRSKREIGLFVGLFAAVETENFGSPLFTDISAIYHWLRWPAN